MKRFIVCLLSFLLSVRCLAGVLTGTVTDSRNQPLPFATVFVAGTTLGTSANAEGKYQLSLPAGSYMVSCQYIGFGQQKFTFSIGAEDKVEHHFVLQDQEMQMQEVVIKSSEDPANYIMRKVIDRRAFHLRQINTFQTDIYLKANLRTRQTPNKVLGEKINKTELGLDTSGKGIIYLLEEFATYTRANGHERTDIRSVRESGDPSGLGVSRFPAVVNFYQNNIALSDRINPRGFISPLSDQAFHYYHFRLEGEFQEGEHTIFKISVTPKRPFEPLFAGDLFVVDSDWSLHSLRVLITKNSGAEGIDTVRIQQFYLPLQPDLWVIKQQVLFLTIKILGFDLVGDFVTVYNNQKVNQSFADSAFNSKIVSQYALDANKKDAGYWEQLRPIPLQKEERLDFLQKDSLRLMLESLHYQDSMRKEYNKLKTTDLLLNGYRYTFRHDWLSIRTNALLTGLVSYNIVEGLNLAPKIRYELPVDSFDKLKGGVALRYGFENRHFNAIGRIIYEHNQRNWRTKSWSIGVEGGKYVFQFNPHIPLSEFYNSLSALFYRRSYLKIYERWEGKLMFSRIQGTGFQWGGSMDYQHRIPLSNTTDFSFAKTNTGGFTENIPAEFVTYNWTEHNAVIGRLWASWQPGFTYTRYPDFLMPHVSRFPVFSVDYEKGIPNLFQSVVDYDKWRASVRGNIRMRMLGALAYNLAGGGFLNTRSVSIPDLNHLNGNRLLLAAPYLESFQIAPYYKYSNEANFFAETHLEWYLKGLLTNKIPLLKQLKWYLVTGSNSYYVRENLYYLEVFAGLDNIGFENLRFFRVDYVRSWNSFHQSSWALRIGISPNSIIKLNLDDREGEW